MFFGTIWTGALAMLSAAAAAEQARTPPTLPRGSASADIPGSKRKRLSLQKKTAAVREVIYTDPPQSDGDIASEIANLILQLDPGNDANVEELQQESCKVDRAEILALAGHPELRDASLHRCRDDLKRLVAEQRGAGKAPTAHARDSACSM